ncbi:sugar O-acetyltransferase [Campylobacter sp. VTCC 70190]|uniref:sugar O-acetyltransferase n=1 Tax=Campylobacter sp. VTCC 70190 TaxID=3392118 RepID=UPI00398F754F
MQDIFQRDLSGEPISPDEPEFHKILAVIKNTQKLLHKLNTKELNENETRELFSQITGQKLDKSVWILPPFYTDFGRNIRVGKNFFLNQNCTFMDRGGIEIGNDVFIAPRVCLATINHELHPYKRKITTCKGIVIKDRVWVGINATICPGVCVGENSIIAAGAVVIKDVPSNVIVGGNPARVIKELKFLKEDYGL